MYFWTGMSNEEKEGRYIKYQICDADTWSLFDKLNLLRERLLYEGHYFLYGSGVIPRSELCFHHGQMINLEAAIREAP